MSECFEKTAVLEGGLAVVARLLHENWVEKFWKDFKLLFLHQLIFIFFCFHQSVPGIDI